MCKYIMFSTQLFPDDVKRFSASLYQSLVLFENFINTITFMCSGESYIARLVAVAEGTLSKPAENALFPWKEIVEGTIQPTDVTNNPAIVHLMAHLTVINTQGF